MAADPEASGFACENCGETFDSKGELDEHMEEVHGATPEERAESGGEDGRAGASENAAAAGADAAGSTGSVTEERNDAPSAAEPAEAAGPSGGDDVRPEGSDRDDAETDETDG